MRHGHRGAAEIASTVDLLFGYAATTHAVGDHHFDALYDAYARRRASSPPSCARANPLRLHGDGGALRGGDRARPVVAGQEQHAGKAGGDIRPRRPPSGDRGMTDEPDRDRYRRPPRREDEEEEGGARSHPRHQDGREGPRHRPYRQGQGQVDRRLRHGVPLARPWLPGRRGAVRQGRLGDGERFALERFGDLVSINTLGEGFTWETQDRQRDIAAARHAWETAKDLIRGGAHHLVVLDELNIVLRHDYLPVQEVIDFLTTEKPADVHSSSSPAATRRTR